MAITRRITVKQEGDNVEQVAFLSDVTLNGITGSGLVTVTGDKDKVVSTDPDKLIVGAEGDVKVVTPLELKAQTDTPAVTANKLYSDGTDLYWNGNVIGVMKPGEIPVSKAEYLTHTQDETDKKHVSATEKSQLDVTGGKPLATEDWASGQFADIVDFNTLSDDVDTIKTDYVSSVTGDESGVVQVAFTPATGATGKAVTTAVTVTNAKQDEITKALSGTGLVTGAQAQDAINAAVVSGVEDAIAAYDADTIGAWTPESTITGTVKTAIEANAAKIAALEGNHFEVVDELPPVSEGKFNVIYLVPNEGDPNNTKDEFILIEEGEPATPKWEQIGTTKVDLSNYFTKEETTSAINTEVTAEETRATAAEGELDTAVKAADAKAVAAQADVDALKTLVGTLPDGTTATTVVDYVDKKASADVTALSGTADTATATDTDGFVTVDLDGTVGNHGLNVTTKDIAKASKVGDVADLTTTAKDTVVAAVNEVADKASTAVQTVSSGDSANIQTTKTGTDVKVTPIGTLADLLAYCTIAEV